MNCLWGCGSAEGVAFSFHLGSSHRSDAAAFRWGGQEPHTEPKVVPLTVARVPVSRTCVEMDARRSSGGVMAFRAAGAKLRNGEGSKLASSAAIRRSQPENAGSVE